MDSDHVDVRRSVLAILEECSVCKCAYHVEDARIVGRNGNLWVLAIRCSQCAAQAFVAAVVSDSLSDVDLAAVDDERVTEAIEPVSIDDVLDMHDFLDNFHGDFTSLFSRRHH